MKRSYVKPELVYESFELAQSIAACALKLNMNDVKDCEVEGGTSGYAVGGFVASNNECSTIIEDYCYTSGAEIIATYMS